MRCCGSLSANSLSQSLRPMRRRLMKKVFSLSSNTISSWRQDLQRLVFRSDMVATVRMKSLQQ